MKTKHKKKIASNDPTSEVAVLALPSTYAEAPDMPVDVAIGELASLARLARTQADPLAKIGIGADKLALVQAFSTALKRRESEWQRARRKTSLSSADRRLVTEAELLRADLIAGGRWALREDDEAQAVLTHISEGAGLSDIVRDLEELLEFWHEHAEALDHTHVTAAELARARELAKLLGKATEGESEDVEAALACELRNRTFWAADQLAGEIREGARYAFRNTPKIATKFVSRYRTAIVRKARRKAARKSDEVTAPTAATTSLVA